MATANEPGFDLDPAHLSERAEHARQAELALTPHFYNPWVHLGTSAGLSLATAAGALWTLDQPTPAQWLTVPITFLLANLYEWFVHRNTLHRRTPGLELLYEKHTPMHHSVYTINDMVLRSTREMRLVLIPALGIAGVIVIMTTIAFGLAQLVHANVARLFLATSAAYVGLYEISHLLYHIDPNSILGRLPGLAVLRRHHAIHHDPRIMQRWNFNVTLPLFDWVFGTATRDPDAAARIEAERRTRRHARSE